MTRYQEIHQIIRRRIFDGEYPLGSNLPSEAAFCTEFGSSRFTVREALRRLQADGMVERKQGACAKVIETAPNMAFIQSVETTSELLQFARDTGYQLLSTQEMTPDKDTLAKIDPQSSTISNETWFLLSGLRLSGANNAPLALIETFVSPLFRPYWQDLSQRNPPFYSFLEEVSGMAITTIEQDIQALSMPPRVRQTLAYPSTDLSLRILRRYKASGRTVLASFNWHLGEENFIFSSTLKQKRHD